MADRVRNDAVGLVLPSHVAVWLRADVDGVLQAGRNGAVVFGLPNFILISWGSGGRSHDESRWS